MTLLKTTPFAAGLLLSVLAGSAAAHHSGSMFDEAKPVVLKGVVQSFDWVNPHSRILITVDAGGTWAGKTWIIETTSTGRLTRDGWTKRSLQPGERIEATVGPAHNGQLIGTLIEVRKLATGEVLGHSKPTAK